MVLETKQVLGGLRHSVRKLLSEGLLYYGAIDDSLAHTVLCRSSYKSKLVVNLVNQCHVLWKSTTNTHCQFPSKNLPSKCSIRSVVTMITWTASPYAISLHSHSFVSYQCNNFMVNTTTVLIKQTYLV